MKGAFLPGNSTVEMKDVPIPEPGHGEVLLRTKVSTICGSDIRAIYREHLGKGPEGYRGVVAGHEPCGQIVKCGPGLRRFGEGDRVIVYHISGCGLCNDCRRGFQISCTSAKYRKAYGWQRDGGMAEYILAEEKDLVALPGNLTYADGAQVACGFGTAYEGLSKIEIGGDHVVLVIGLGPVGLASLMLARAMGASKLIGVDISEFRANLCESKGLADHVIVAGGEEALAKIKELTGGAGCERVLDASGSGPGRLLGIQATRQWGRMVLVGEGGNMTMMPSPDMIHDQKTLYGSWVTSIWRMEELVERLSRWKIHPADLITHRFPLEKAGDAYSLMASGNCGKVAVCFDEELIGQEFTPQVKIPIQSKAQNGLESFPAIGLGTFGSDNYTAAQIATAVNMAMDMGYRHFDCAAAYRNEVEVGKVIKTACARNGLKREDVWITGKLWNDSHEDAITACKKSIADLDCDYLDLYLVHWPFPNYHPPGCSVESIDSNARSYIHENFMKTWAAMEELVDLGLVRRIGTSNVTQAKMELILKDCKVKPCVNEMEIHPHFQQPELYEYMRKNDIEVVGFCPLGSPGRPDRDRTVDDTIDLEDPVVVEIAKEFKVHPASIAIAWAVKRGQVTIPQSCSERNIRANLIAATVLSRRLTDEHMTNLSKIDKRCRLIKGQVFCWKKGQDWHDLWDEDGKIAQ